MPVKDYETAFHGTPSSLIDNTTNALDCITKILIRSSYEFKEEERNEANAAHTKKMLRLFFFRYHDTNSLIEEAENMAHRDMKGLWAKAKMMTNNADFLCRELKVKYGQFFENTLLCRVPRCRKLF